MRKLQTLQKKILWIKCGLSYETSTSELIEKTGDLSVHQLCAHTTLTSAHKAIISKQARFMHTKLMLRNKNFIPAHHRLKNAFLMQSQDEIKSNLI